jgi:hypothetical protein
MCVEEDKEDVAEDNVSTTSRDVSTGTTWRSDLIRPSWRKLTNTVAKKIELAAAKPWRLIRMAANTTEYHHQLHQ